MNFEVVKTLRLFVAPAFDDKYLGGLLCNLGHGIKARFWIGFKIWSNAFCLISGWVLNCLGKTGQNQEYVEYIERCLFFVRTKTGWYLFCRHFLPVFGWTRILLEKVCKMYSFVRLSKPTLAMPPIIVVLPPSPDYFSLIKVNGGEIDHFSDYWRCQGNTSLL